MCRFSAIVILFSLGIASHAEDCGRVTAFAKNATGTFDVTLEYTQTFKARVELAVLVAAVASIAPHLQFCFEKGKDGIYELTSAERD